MKLIFIIIKQKNINNQHIPDIPNVVQNWAFLAVGIFAQLEMPTFE